MDGVLQRESRFVPKTRSLFLHVTTRPLPNTSFLLSGHVDTPHPRNKLSLISGGEARLKAQHSFCATLNFGELSNFKKKKKRSQISKLLPQVSQTEHKTLLKGSVTSPVSLRVYYIRSVNCTLARIVINACRKIQLLICFSYRKQKKRKVRPQSTLCSIRAHVTPLCPHAATHYKKATVSRLCTSDACQLDANPLFRKIPQCYR